MFYIYTNNKLSSITTSSGTTEVTWDANGNLLDDGSYTYIYNHANQLIEVSAPLTTISYAYNGLGERIQETADGMITNITVDLNSGLSQVLSDETNTYLYGIERIAQESTNGEQFFLGDALGSVRQLVDENESVQLVKSYRPYGESLFSGGNGATNYGYTNEYTSQGLIYLRSRYYSPENGQFLTQDPWQGDDNKPITLNKWVYANANPIIYVDRTGLSPIVNCAEIWLNDVRALCYAANGDDNDPNVLQARYQFFKRIADTSKLIGIVDEGFWWAGEMLDHFLNKGGIKKVELPSNTSFASDSGILRATKILLPKIPGFDEPDEIEPLAYEFLKTIRPKLGCDFYQNLGSMSIIGSDNYLPIGSLPRPRDKFTSIGWWGAFGHVAINATYSNIEVLRYSIPHMYYLSTTINYKIDDVYEWFPGQKSTPLPLGKPDVKSPFLVQVVYIPHDWEGSLASHGLAAEYPFTITWSERLTFILPEDFNQFSLSDGTGPFDLPR